MSKTIAESAAAYRQRKAEKLLRWENALRYIAAWEIWDVEDAIEMRAQARLALNPENAA